MSRHLAGGALLAATLVAAHAPPETGSILPDPTAQLSARAISPADRARQTMNDYAACVVKKHFMDVRKFLAIENEAVADTALNRLSTNDCLGTGELRMSPMLMRGAVFRALYLRDFGRSPPAEPEDAPVALADDTPLRVFARCVNGADRVDARALIASVPATPVEQGAIASLRPAMTQCVPPTAQFRLNPAVLQGALAEAAYRQAASSVVVTR